MSSSTGDATAASSSCGECKTDLIELYRKKRAAEKAAEEQADGVGCGGENLCLVNKHTGKEQNELKPKLTIDQVQSMFINKLERTPNASSAVQRMMEEEDEMEAQLEDLIGQIHGEKGVEVSRQKGARFLRGVEEFQRQFRLELEVQQLRKEKDELYSKLLSERGRCSVLVEVQREQIKERDEEIASLRKRIKEFEVWALKEGSNSSCK